jgi:GntR family transcriptional regulator / MocR family aminotransferase
LLRPGDSIATLRRVRTRYRPRRDALARSLSRLAPHVTLTGIAAGIQAVANLPEHADEQELVTAAAGRNVGLYGMSTYRSSPTTGAPALVLGYARLSESAIALAITEIADLLNLQGSSKRVIPCREAVTGSAH